MAQELRFDDRMAIVTGGRWRTRACLRPAARCRGAHVVVNDIDRVGQDGRTPAAAVCAEIADKGERHSTRPSRSRTPVKRWFRPSWMRLAAPILW